METQNNFAIGSIPKHIMSIAGPMIVAQLINVLYNVIDRIYIGRIPHVATLAMGGLGIVYQLFPLSWLLQTSLVWVVLLYVRLLEVKVKMMTLKKSWGILLRCLSFLELF